MIKFAGVISFLVLGFVGVCFADYEINKITISIPQQNMFFSCTKSAPEGDVVFFEIYADDGKHLYDFFGSSPLPMAACRDVVRDSQKILKDAEFITLSGHDRMAGHHLKREAWDNELVRKYRGKIHEASFFSQISNGKTCNCWFEGCTCLPIVLDGPRPNL